MNRMHWTVPEVVDLPAEAHWLDLGGQGLDPDPITLKGLARALHARPKELEEKCRILTVVDCIFRLEFLYTCTLKSRGSESD